MFRSVNLKEYFLFTSTKNTWDVGVRITDPVLFFAPKGIEIPVESDGTLEITYSPLRMATDTHHEVSRFNILFSRLILIFSFIYRVSFQM